MPLTKDQISDLRSIQERVVTCAVDHEKATEALRMAKAQLGHLLWRLEHEKEAVTK
jgi:hypothetical protein